MGRYTGPSCKKCRRSNQKLLLKGARCETAKCSFEKRPFVPGPKAKIPRKLSEFGRRLREKQKLRFFYGVSEKHMRIYYAKANRQKGVTGHNLLSLFEKRLDNVIYRTHLAASRKQARQLVKHGHFLVNDRKVDIPSFITKEGDVVTIKQKSQKVLEDRFEIIKQKGTPVWIAYDQTKKAIQIQKSPSREEMDVPIEEQLIIEFYSR
jgi:small subunit ribosomal protein S4